MREVHVLHDNTFMNVAFSNLSFCVCSSSANWAAVRGCGRNYGYGHYRL